MNKNLIIAKLERLNVFTQEKVEETDNSIVYWGGGLKMTCKTCKYGVDYGDSVQYIYCEHGKKKKSVEKDSECEKYISQEERKL